MGYGNPNHYFKYVDEALDYEAADFQFSSAKQSYDEAGVIWNNVADTLEALMQ